jgi:hypothetical protein
MYAPHFAAALALKSRTPKAPALALLVGAFLPDFLWAVLAALGVEPTARAVFFDDWSHSLATVALQAVLFAALFRRRGRAVMLAVGLGVLSHFVLDLPIHPQPLALYPHSAIHLSLGLPEVSRRTYWWLQAGLVAVLAAVYVMGAREQRWPRNLVAATCVTLASLQLIML